jgi:hypothetical protein
VAVLTGGHPYDAPNFNRMFRSIPDVEYYVQAIDEFCKDAGSCADQYDVIMFYNIQVGTGSWGSWWCDSFFPCNLFAKCHHGMYYYPTKIGTMHPTSRVPPVNAAHSQ